MKTRRDVNKKYFGFTRKRNGSGFTLIELLVVIMIIGILATVVMMNLIDSPKKARDAKRTADVNSIKTALGMYYEDYGSYPKCEVESTYGCSLEKNGIVDSEFEALSKYIATLPRDPKTNSGYQYKRNNASSYQIQIGYEKQTRGCDFEGTVCLCLTGVNIPSGTICQ